MCEGFMCQGERVLGSVYGTCVSKCVRSSVKGRKWICVL